MSAPESTVAAWPPLATVIHDARRSRDLTPDGLASAAGVAVADVVALERGEAVDAARTRAVLSAVGVDAAPHVPGSPPGLVPVRAVDAAHSQVMGYLAEVTAGEPGWVLLPDVSALAARLGPAPGDDALDRRTTAGQVLQGLMNALAAFVCLGLLQAGVEAATGWGGLVPGSVFVVVMVPGVMTWWTLSDVIDMDSPHAVRAGQVADARKLCDACRGYAYGVSGTGVVTYQVTDEGLRRREYPASSISAARLRPEDEVHVTVELDTILGPVTMPWLPRTRDLADLAAAWNARGERARSAYLEGPQ